MKESNSTDDQGLAVLLSRVLTRFAVDLKTLFEKNELVAESIEPVGTGLNQRVRVTIRERATKAESLILQKMQPTSPARVGSCFIEIRVSKEKIEHYATLGSMLKPSHNFRTLKVTAPNNDLYVKLSSLVPEVDDKIITGYCNIRTFLEYVLKYEYGTDISRVDLAYRKFHSKILAVVKCTGKSRERVIRDFNRRKKGQYIIQSVGQISPRTLFISVVDFPKIASKEQVTFTPSPREIVFQNRKVPYMTPVSNRSSSYGGRRAKAS